MSEALSKWVYNVEFYCGIVSENIYDFIRVALKASI